MELSPEIVQWITSLNRNVFRGRPRPHKPVLLLAILELAESGQLPVNKVYFGPALFEYFGEYWQALTDEPVNKAKIQYPFWHMDSEPFWTLVAKPGFEDKLSRGKRYSPSAKQIREWVAYAQFEEKLFEAIQDRTTRNLIRHLIIGDAFADRVGQVEKLRRFESSVYQYSEVIRKLADGAVTYAIEAPPQPVRDAAFRRVVLETYEYTCAVSGVRLSLPRGGGYELVQAAHIRDWADSYDDNPQNGMALTPDYHWMFERGLFTISNDYRVMVSRAVSECIGSTRELLLALKNKPIRLPTLHNRRPDIPYLEWHRNEKFIS